MLSAPASGMSVPVLVEGLSAVTGIMFTTKILHKGAGRKRIMTSKAGELHRSDEAPSFFVITISLDIIALLYNYTFFNV